MTKQRALLIPLLALALFSCVDLEPAGGQDAGACRLPGMLPETRDETATGASPVSSSLANRIQDCIIVGKHGLLEFTYAPFPGERTNFDRVGQYIVSTGVATYARDIELKPGDTLDRVEIQIYGEAPSTADFTAAALFLTEADMSNGLIPGASNPINNVSAAWQILTITPTDPTLLLAGENVFLSLGANAAGLRIGTISVFKKRI